MHGKHHPAYMGHIDPLPSVVFSEVPWKITTVPTASVREMTTVNRVSGKKDRRQSSASFYETSKFKKTTKVRFFCLTLGLHRQTGLNCPFICFLKRSMFSLTVIRLSSRSKSEKTRIDVQVHKQNKRKLNTGLRINCQHKVYKNDLSLRLRLRVWLLFSGQSL